MTQAFLFGLNRPFHLTLEGIQLRVNEIASFSGVPWKAVFGVKCIELTGFFSAFEASLYRNYVEFSNKPNSIISAETNSKFYYSNSWCQNDRIFD